MNHFKNANRSCQITCLSRFHRPANIIKIIAAGAACLNFGSLVLPLAAGDQLRLSSAGLCGVETSPSPTASGPRPAGSPQCSATNLMLYDANLPARFLLPDSGQGIPYWIDADYLPAGVSQTQAVAAVQVALAAWTNACSVRYRFEGIQSFGMAASAVPASDGKLLIQLHDHYHVLGSIGSDILGIGGQAYVVAYTPSGWTTGGDVLGNDFHKVLGGFVVIQDNSEYNQNLTNLASVLCHEIGHTLGLAHTTDPESIMGGGGGARGATLSATDTNDVRQVHPVDNTPPYCDCNLRVIDAVTSPNPLSVPWVNTVQVPGCDLQTSNLTFLTADAWNGTGTFSNSYDAITYTAGWAWDDTGRFDPMGGSFWDVIYARYSDGTNASGYAIIKVISLNKDSYSEGIPDWWRLAYFGSADPSAGPRRHATDDFDGDGFSNVVEWRLGSNPTDPNSNLRPVLLYPTNLQFQAKGCELYELYSSTNLITWTRVLNPFMPTNFVPGTNLLNLTNSLAIVSDFTNGGPKQFFRVAKVL